MTLREILERLAPRPDTATTATAVKILVDHTEAAIKQLVRDEVDKIAASSFRAGIAAERQRILEVIGDDER